MNAQTSQPSDGDASQNSGAPIRKGDIVRIKKEYQDAGDEKYTWVACDSESKGRVTITPHGTGLSFPPSQTVRVDMLEPEANRKKVEEACSSLRHARVGIIDHPAFPCLLEAGHWNGYARPNFTKEVGEKICEAFLSAKLAEVARYDETTDSFVIRIEEIDWTGKGEVIDGVKLYPIGKDGMCWEVCQPTRADLFMFLPTLKGEALQLLREFKAANLTWHFDDDPREIVLSEDYSRNLFTEEESEFAMNLVKRLNELFFSDCTNPEVANAGAWHAADLVNRGGMEPDTDPDPAAPSAATEGNDVPVIVHLENGQHHRASLTQFLADNKEGLTLAEIETICNTIKAGASYTGGGGASGMFTIEPAPVFLDLHVDRPFNEEGVYISDKHTALVAKLYEGQEHYAELFAVSPKLLDVAEGLLDEIDRCGVKVSAGLEKVARNVVAVASAPVDPQGQGRIFEPLDARELATVLAALRIYQGHKGAGVRWGDVDAILEGVEPLTVQEIDALCERLNTEGKA